MRRRTIPVNMILENGVIRTMEPSLPLARSLAIVGDKIAGGVGTHETALPGPERIDLGGRCVLPGFTDSHVHFPTWAMAQHEVRLEGTASMDEAIARVRDALATTERASGWLRGRGWRSGDWTSPAEPTKEALDAIAPDRPVALMARDSHSVWLNSAALAHASGDLQVPGGVVELDEHGEPTGVLREESCWHFRDRYIDTTDDEYVEAMRTGIKLAASRGVTAVHDKDGWLGALRFWQRLADDGVLTLRVWQSLPEVKADELAEVDVRGGFGNALLKVGYLKAFMDGTLGSATARLLDGSGVQITSREELEDYILRAAQAGFPIGVHAIGDLANREALDAFEATREAWQPLGLRQRIEHAQLLAPEDVQRFAQLGITASVQFSHAPSDRDLADRIWSGTTSLPYAYRSLLDSGATLVNGSDAPIEELDPLEGLRAGVLRTLDEREAWRPEQAVTVEEALIAGTVAPAWLARDERRRGKLVPGFFADLVVLDRDPLTCEPEELAETRVVATMLGGAWTHDPPPW
ncbi:MAG TPA: amidohydrolase [Gaiellaceae bacterium]|nr:amidohydrolase [Gaiellaceae bacterium]